MHKPNEYNPNFKSDRVLCIVGTKAVLQNESGEILLLLRSDKVGHPGKWGLPGGGLEMNETPLTCITREVEEEIQVTPAELKLFSTNSLIDPNHDFTVIIGYKGFVSAKSNIVINWEHDTYQWISKEKALRLDNLTKTTRLFIEQLEN